MSRYYDELMGHMKALPVIDSHEHLPGKEERRSGGADVLSEYFSLYINDDLRAAGMPQEQYRYVCDTAQPLMARWSVLEPYWKLVANTGFARVLKLSARDIYGIERIDTDTIATLNEAFCAAKKTGHFHRVLKEMCHIEYSVLDNVLDYNNLDVDPDCFRSAYRINAFFKPCFDGLVEAAERYAGFGIGSFDDLLTALETTVDKALADGAVAFKIGLAGDRTLYFSEAPEEAARAYFDRVFRKKLSAEESFVLCDPARCPQLVAYQDFMMHYFMRLANERNAVVQFHTGMPGGGSTVISDTDPAKLCNLFMKYPKVKFELFHLGYPYQNVMPALGKMFPNVYLDMCWAHAISPAACTAALDDWLDSVPVNKIIAFGGDYTYVDAVCGHLLLAKMNVSEVLARKVEKGIYTMEEAKWIAERLFYRNPKELFEGKQTTGNT